MIVFPVGTPGVCGRFNTLPAAALRRRSLINVVCAFGELIGFLFVELAHHI